MSLTPSKFFSFILTIAVFGCFGCSPEHYGPRFEEDGSHLTLYPSYVPDIYGSYLEKMEDTERLMFDRLKSDADRNRFIREYMIDVRIRLSDQLSSGMDSSQVQTILSKPDEILSRSHRETVHEDWLYRHFNGYRHAYYSLHFQDNRLVDWQTHHGGRQ
ncbi:MAG: hypothetical protein QF752_02325 [Planctomycetota bacterium]|jgi:hypothetical protein|nr:hypothetical protein [Planctomycetota bacterium]